MRKITYIELTFIFIEIIMKGIPIKKERASMKTCFFIGNHDAPESVRRLLDEAIERHIAEYGAGGFTVGNYGAFDCMAQAALADAKKRHDTVTLMSEDCGLHKLSFEIL